MALVVSVALNLCVVGIVVGVVLRHDQRDPRAAMGRDFGFGPFSQAFDHEDRAALRKAFFEQSRGFRQARQNMRQDMNSVLLALRAEPFDPQALQAALARQQKHVLRRLEIGQKLMADYIEAMTPDARMRFADRLEAASSRRGD